MQNRPEMALREFRTAGIASILLGALPFAIYAVERLAGLLPTEEGWIEKGVNHGPWRWEPEGFTILYPLFALALVTIVVSATRAVRRQKFQALSLGAGLLAIQISMIALQIYFLFWLID